MPPPRSPVVGMALLVAMTVTTACADGEFTEIERQVIETLSPLPPTPPADPTNAYADDSAAAEVGQMFFFDRAFSGPLTLDSALGKTGDSGLVSCATCHTPQAWFQDIRAERTSVGAIRTTLNNMTIVNAAYNDWPYWSGNADTYWMQPVTALEDELNGDRVAIARQVALVYRAEYEAIFPTPLDPALDPADPGADRFPEHARPGPPGEPWSDAWSAMAPEDRETINRITANVGKAIGAYTRRLVSRDAPFDQFVAGDEAAIGAAAKRGLKLFIGKAGCVECHSGPLFSDGEFHNTTVPQLPNPEQNVPAEDLGFYAGLVQVVDSPFNAAGPFSDDRNASKLSDVNLDDGLRHTFRTQSLRHIAPTAPFMHAGQFATLMDVVRFYDQGGTESGYPGVKDPELGRLFLDVEEMTDLVSFLESLTGAPVEAHLTVDTSKR